MYLYIIDSHSQMLNVTARVAVEIKNIPHWMIDLTDHTAERPCYINNF